MKKVLIFVVAYHAESHIVSVLERIPKEIWDSEKYTSEILIIDDASADRTKQVCDIYKETRRRFNLKVLRNPVNQGYGGNQKIGYLYAIKNNFDIVVLLHGDGQYAPECLCAMIEPIVSGDADFVIGSRMLNKLNALKGGMPLYKFIGNRILTFLQNRIIKTRLSEFHSGYRAYNVKALRSLPFQCNSNDFDFDTDIIIQMLDNKYRIKEIPIPTFYGDEICYVNGFKYAWDIIKNSIISRLQCVSIIYEPKFDYSHGNFIYESKVDFPSSHSYALGQIEDNSIILDL
ncbi:MAG: glycosyltransferase family 2 protein, partial [Lentisphaerota bacterium]